MNHALPSRPLRLPATLVFAGVVLSVVAGLFHAGPPANNHVVAFTEYARSTPWIAVHLGQFTGMLLIVAGLVALFVMGSAQPGQPTWLGRFGALAAVLSLGLYGVLQAVDGVALKHAVDAWAAAPEAEKAARFASAETVRWLEWAVRSYHSFLFGLSLVLLGWWIARIGGLQKAIGYVMCLAGLTYLVQGWVLGVEGFSAANELAIVLGIVLTVGWSVWLLVATWATRTDNASGPMRPGRVAGVLIVVLTGAVPAVRAAQSTPHSLFNGVDLAGWHADVPAADTNPQAPRSFIVRNGLLVSLGDPRGHLITDSVYHDYRLEIEYRFPGKPGNAGVLVHASTPRALYKMFPRSIEVQMEHGNAGDFWCIVEDIRVPNMERRRGPPARWGGTEGKARRILNLTDSSEKALGEWNTMVIEAVGRAIRVWVNGDLVNDGTDATADRGKIALQAEGSEVEFRKLELTPIAMLTPLK